MNDNKRKKKKKGKKFFNIYYINYAKAYEIAMLVNNKILEEIQKEAGFEQCIEGKAETGLGMEGIMPIPISPKITFSGDASGSKSGHVIDTFKVVSTKSTILKSIYETSKEIDDFSQIKAGNLIRIKGVSLEVQNKNEILGIKTLLSGALAKIDLEGIGNIDLASLFGVIFKDSAYIINGRCSNNAVPNFMIRIPAQAINELENQYSISDIEIGDVTVIGVYRGKYKRKDILNIMDNIENKYENDSTEIVLEGGIEENFKAHYSSEDVVHYIDIIPIVQDIFI